MRERGAGAHRHVGCCRTEHGERLRTIRASVPAEKSHLPTCVKSTSSCGTRPRGSPERHHSHYPALGRPIRPYEWTVQPRGERDRTQVCHGSPDESGPVQPVGRLGAHGENREEKVRSQYYFLRSDWRVCFGGPGEPSGVVRRPRPRPPRLADGSDALGARRRGSPAGVKG